MAVGRAAVMQLSSGCEGVAVDLAITRTVSSLRGMNLAYRTAIHRGSVSATGIDRLGCKNSRRNMANKLHLLPARV